jgi:hypothetical protein
MVRQLSSVGHTVRTLAPPDRTTGATAERRSWDAG